MNVRMAENQMARNDATKRILATVLFAVVAAGSAVASDLPPPVAPAPRAPAVYLPPAPVYNWTGFYLGINGGWGFGKSDWNLANAVPPVNTGSFNVNGGLVGGTVGFNWWSDGWVVGLEGDFDGSWLDGKASICGVPNCETKNKWLATLRPRFGYAADRVLFYLTGGVAFGDVVVNTTPNWQSTDKTGWTAGAGLEGAFTDHWTARLEYLYVNLQNSTFTPTTNFPVGVKFNANLIRAGVDYKF
jgi:outer membrane immunogenic protein